jgi:hypothetical protein
MGILEQLKAPFPADAISWRVGSTNKKNWQQGQQRRGQPLAYLDARDVMARLDEVMGADWQCEYVAMPNGTCCCRIGLKIDGEWRWRSNGAGATDVEAEKGAYSDAFKRAAVLWGIGQYLYNVDAPWLTLDERWAIRDEDKSRLAALLTRNNPGASSKADAKPSRAVGASAEQGVQLTRPGPTTSQRAAATIRDPRAAALEKRAAKMTPEESETALNLLRVALDACKSLDNLREFSAKNRATIDMLTDDHVRSLRQEAEEMRGRLKAQAAAA